MGQLHLISFGSTVQKRVVNSTIKAETYQLVDVVESADLLRAALADAHGQLDTSNWEDSAASYTMTQWCTDCRSCYDTLQKPIKKTISKRLGIELASLRQLLWRQSGHSLPERRLLEEKPKDPTDIISWVDTTIMVADCLTKAMKETYLMKVLNTNEWGQRQTEQMKEDKARKSYLRRTAKERHGLREAVDSEDDAVAPKDDQ